MLLLVIQMDSLAAREDDRLLAPVPRSIRPLLVRYDSFFFSHRHAAAVAAAATLGADDYVTLTFTMKYHPLIIGIPSHFLPIRQDLLI